MQITGSLARRTSLVDDLVATLRGLVISGGLRAGSRINEVRLAGELGVSRTPLREALARLGHEGAIQSAPRLGWYVRPLSVQEFEQIYPIRSYLDPEALRLSGIPPRPLLDGLDDLNAKIAKSSDVEEIISLDDDWHRKLLEGCPNTVLLGLIDQFIALTRRYEIALMREQQNVSRSMSCHSQIVKLLRQRDLAGACHELRRNLEAGSTPILNWLAELERGEQS